MSEASLLLGGALALVCGVSAVAIARARKHHAEADQPGLFCALLGFTLAAAAGACTVTGVQAAQLWLAQAVQFLALPLIAATALALSRSWTWSRPNWGRILLGLCAFFELFRQMQQLDNYRILINGISVLLILYAGTVQWPRRTPVLLSSAAASLLFLASVCAANRLSLGRLNSTDSSQLLLIVAYGLMAWLLLSLPGQRKAE